MKLPNFLTKYGNEIIFGTCLAGMFGGAITAVVVTPKAVADMNEETDKWERIKAAAKHYILPGSMMILSSIGLVAVLVNKNKEISNLAIACAGAEKLYSEYKEKVVESIGEKKEAEIQDKITHDKIEKTEVPASLPVSTHNDTSSRYLCFDAWSGRYFESNKQHIENALNRANAALVRNGYLSLNEFYYYLGLDEIDGGNIGWNRDWLDVDPNDLIAVRYYSDLKSGEQPVFAFAFETIPKTGYDRFS